MAGPASNFDAEIKKGMKSGNNGGRGGGSVAQDQQPGNHSSTNTAPSKAGSGNNTNEWNQSSGPVGQDGGSGGINGDTHAQMIAAGQAHMAAIHNHINAITNGKGAGGDSPVNQGTRAK